MTYTKDVVPTSENFVWEFMIESNVKEEKTSIGWDNSYFGDRKEIYLLDVASHIITDMRGHSMYEFNTAGSREFKVVFGSAEFIKQELIPNKAILFDPYPNPSFNQVVIEYSLPKEAMNEQGELKIYNYAGEEISTMNTLNQPGNGQWVWENETQSPGMYLVRLKIGNQLVFKKIIKR